MKTLHIPYEIAKNSSASERLAMHKKYDKVTVDDFKKVIVFEKFNKPVNERMNKKVVSCSL